MTIKEQLEQVEAHLAVLRSERERAQLQVADRSAFGTAEQVKTATRALDKIGGEIRAAELRREGLANRFVLEQEADMVASIDEAQATFDLAKITSREASSTVQALTAQLNDAAQFAERAKVAEDNAGLILSSRTRKLAEFRAANATAIELAKRLAEAVPA